MPQKVRLRCLMTGCSVWPVDTRCSCCTAAGAALRQPLLAACSPALLPPSTPARLGSCRAQQPGLWFDDRCVLLADMFPKARQHWLVLARDARLGGALDLTAADVPLLEHMLVRWGALGCKHVLLNPRV